MILTPCKKRPVLQPCTLPDRNYQVDPYIGCGHYCYYCYALNQAETDWREEVLIHKDITSQLESELAGITPVIWIYGLSIINRSDQNWLNMQNILKREFPDLLERIEPAIFSKEDHYWVQLKEDLVTLKNDQQLKLNIRLWIIEEMYRKSVTSPDAQMVLEYLL